MSILESAALHLNKYHKIETKTHWNKKVSYDGKFTFSKLYEVSRILMY